MKKTFSSALAALFLATTMTGLAWAGSFSFEQAIERTKREVPGGTVKSVERDFEYGRAVIEVEILDKRGLEHELIFDAEDGTLLAHKIDD